MREGVSAGAHRSRRQHHDRLVRNDAAADRSGRGAATQVRSGARRVRRRDAAPSVERRRPRDARPIWSSSCSPISRHACRWCSRFIRARARSSRSSACWQRAASRQLRSASPSRSATCEFMALVSGARAPRSPTPAACRKRSTYLGIPCLTLRENTERPITVTQGQQSPRAAATACSQTSSACSPGQWPTGSRPDGWDGARRRERCVASSLKRERELRQKSVS